MTFLKPNKLIFSIFGLPFLFLISPLLGNFVGSYNLPGFLGYLIFAFNLFSVAPLFGIFRILGINLGRSTDFLGLPEPNFFGWVMILFIWAIIYYLIANAISRLITEDKKRNVVFYILSLIAIAYACLLIFDSVALAKRGRLVNKRVQECLAPAQQAYDSCVTACQSDSGLFGPVSERITNKTAEASYTACFNNCGVVQDNFIKECNGQNQLKP